MSASREIIVNRSVYGFCTGLNKIRKPPPSPSLFWVVISEFFCEWDRMSL